MLNTLLMGKYFNQLHIIKHWRIICQNLLMIEWIGSNLEVSNQCRLLKAVYELVFDFRE
ncbi:hypothetical protein IMSAGC020_02366 [Lachnospiraceae bacterium]|nr:hypothetical protein IMSAGC020_02366 [Lachnospiraceae bacterium]